MGVPLYTHSPAAQAHYMEAMYLRAASRSADPSLPAAVSPHTPSKQLYTPGMPLFTTGASPGAEKSVSTSPDLIAAPINVDEQWGRENEWLEVRWLRSGASRFSLGLGGAVARVGGSV